MKAADRLSQQLGANIVESMGVARSTGAAFPPPGPVHGGPADKYQGAARVKDALAIEVGRLSPDPDQPRKEFDEAALADLAASLKARGQLQPIRVRWDDAMNRWVIVAGERRYRAALLAGLPTLTCIEAKGTPTPDEVLEDQLVENCLREDLKPIEQARAFRALIDRRGCSQRQLAEMLHVSHQAVIRALALLDLPADVQDQVESGAVPPSAAAAVARVEDEAAQRAIIGKLATGAMTRDEAVEEARRVAGRSAGKAKGRGAGKAKAPRPRTFRTATARVTVEPKRGAPADGIRAALAEALAMLDAEGEGRGEQAA